MDYPEQFICATKDYTTYRHFVPAPYYRKVFTATTDCPHREKVGWTGDAALSSEHMLMAMDVGVSFREWLRSIRAAQKETGELPGMVPACDWPYQWGDGPVWDAALICLPYYTYQYTGDREILSENAAAILKYLHFAAGRRNSNGLIDYGLGDWCPIGERVKPTIAFTGSVALYTLAKMAALIFDVLENAEAAAFARQLSDELRAAVRRHLMDTTRCVADTGCQTSQAMALYYGVFDKTETATAAAHLLEQIHGNGNFLDTGILGARVLFHVLSDLGESELAWTMITRKDFPSYGALIGFGETTLPEFFRRPGAGVYSHNHHMYGDIKNWFISAVAGLRYNPTRTDHRHVLVKPAFLRALTFAEASYVSPFGELFVRWERTEDEIRLRVCTPDGITAEIVLHDGTQIVHTGDHVYSYSFAK